MLRPFDRFDFAVAPAGLSHLGYVRQNNEDSFRIDAELSVFAVADGMGGHSAGEVAAALAIETVTRELGKDAARAAVDAYATRPTLDARRRVFETLRSAASVANDVVREAGERTPEYRGMGTTLDLVLLARDRAFVLHVGDGRVYLRRSTTTIQLTHDHDHRALLASQGKLPLARRNTVHNQLLNAIGRGRLVYADCIVVGVSPGDRLVLCTDGVHEMLGEEAVVAEHARAGSPPEAAAALIDAALARGGRDNATTLVIDVGERLVPRAEMDPLGISPEDMAAARTCPLLGDLPDPTLLRALAMAVEVELPPGDALPWASTTDLVAYVVLEGEVEVPSAHMVLGKSALIYAESLLGIRGASAIARAVTPVRALRLRADDFREVCAQDARLAAALYERLARHLARARFG